MNSIDVRRARRLALVRGGLVKPEWTGLPRRARGGGKRARRAAHRLLRRFGYLQLDTVGVAGARSHVLVLLSRFEGIDPDFGEALLRPGEPVFEYWAHEACWLPMELYPAFEFRRGDFEYDPWYGDVVGKDPALAREVLDRIEHEGPLRSADFEGETPAGSGWYPKAAKRVLRAYWSNGVLAVSERRSFQRSFDLAERVIPEEIRRRPLDRHRGLKVLLERALAGHGWATRGTLARTWRLSNLTAEIDAALAELESEGRVVPCSLQLPQGKRQAGWIRPRDLDLAERAATLRPRSDRGVLLSPFDPALWDRERTKLLFGFEQVLEIFKPAHQRRWGYYCLPVLAGERLVGRVDLKADRRAGTIATLARYLEDGCGAREDRAIDVALDRHARAVGLDLVTVR